MSPKVNNIRQKRAYTVKSAESPSSRVPSKSSGVRPVPTADDKQLVADIRRRRAQERLA